MLLVQAPAGCGKTATLLQFLLDRGVDVRWHTCSLDDADPVNLMTSLVKVLGGDDSVAGQTTLAALRSGDIRQSYRAALKPFLETLGPRRGESVVLVVDDIDAILGSRETMDILDYLVSACSSYMSIVLMSRAELPLGSQAKRLLEGNAARVMTEDLLFRPDEVGELAQHSFGLALAADEAKGVYRATGGWAIATCLSLRLRQMGSIVQREEDAHFTPEARADLFAYLASEVLTRIDARIERFLRSTAILESLDPRVCARLAGEERAAELIQSLAAAGLPVTKASWSVYRCHSLLREFFLAKMSDEELLASHRAAGEACEAAGDFSSALVHLSAAGDTRAALLLADAQGAALFRSGRGRALVDLAKASSPAERAEHYPALYWAAVAASRMFDWDWAAVGFAEVKSAAGARGDAEMAREALRSLAYMLNVWGRFAPASTVASELITSISDDQCAARAAAALGHVVPGMTGSGQFTKAVELIRSELPKLSLEPRAEVDAEAFARAVAAVTLARDGDFAAAGAQLSLAGALTPGCTDDVVRTQVPWTRAMVAFLAGDPDAAEVAAREAEGLALQVGDLQRILECRALQAMVHLLRGRAREAERGFSDVDELRAGITNFWVTILTLLSRPRRLLLSGDAVGALTAAESNHALASGVGEAWFVCFSRLEVIYLRILNGDVTSAVEMARKALAEARALKADLLLYGAHLMLAASSEEEREASLAEALRIADVRDYRFVMPYAARLPQLDAALWRALGTDAGVRASILLEGAGPAACAALRPLSPELDEVAAVRATAVLARLGANGRETLGRMAALPSRQVSAAAKGALAELDAANPHGLTRRELEVLQLVGQGMRTKDVAERLVLTPATVSTHIQRIMNKTQTSSRAQLVALALREAPSTK